MWWHGRDPTDDEPLTHADLAPAFDLDAYLARIRDGRTDDLAVGQRRRPDELAQLPLFRR